MVNTPPLSPVRVVNETWLEEPSEGPSGLGEGFVTPPDSLQARVRQNPAHEEGTSTAGQSSVDSGMEGRIMESVTRLVNASMERQAEMFMKMFSDRNAESRRTEVNAGVINPTINPGPEMERRVDRYCSYKTFLSCKPPKFKGDDC